MDVDTLNSNQSSFEPARPSATATITKTPHHSSQQQQLPLATPSPENSNGDMAPRPKATSLPRAVSLSSSEQSSEGETAESLVTPAPAKKNANAMDLTSDDIEEEPKLRRSKRDKKSTLVYINGQPVLAKNNYQLKGLTYQYGNDFETAPQRAAAKTNAAAKSKRPSKPRAVTEQEAKRVSHNDLVKKRVQDKQERRTQFLASNLSTMEPFLDDQVAAQLKGASDMISTVPSQQELFLQPEAIQADMRDYQLEGLNWMVKMHEANLGMILGDEMGLGKTLQTISLLCHLKERDGISGPSLVLCPLSVLSSWCAELEKWAPSLKFLRLHSSSAEEREAQKLSFQEKATEYDVVITTYDQAKAQGLRSLWSRQYFHYLILDEGHKIKDATSQISQAVRLIHCENSLILTGTPLQNNLIELWSLLNFLYPDVFVTNDRFAEAFNLTDNIINKDKLLEAHGLLGLFMLRRLKNEVEKLLPKKVETKVVCPLSKTQIFWYKALLMKDINLLARTTGDEASGGASASRVLSNLVMQLRKCCLHPYLFEGAETDVSSTTCEDLIAASGKLAVLDKLLRSLYEKNHRVVLFSQFTSVLNILDDYCTMRGFKHCRFDGSTPRAMRNFVVKQFNAPGSDHFVFLMSTRSGGMGLNLQTADTCILFDSDWNPQPDLQAMARVHRIGQKKTVHVYRLVCGGTIEERMVERAQKKLYLDQMVNQDSLAGIGNEDELGSVSKGELLATLKFGCDAVFGGDEDNKNTLPTEHDIEVITDRNRSETFSEGNLKGGATDQASTFKADEEFTSTTKLGGIDFKEIRDKHKTKGSTSHFPKDVGGITNAWAKLEKRNRKSRIVKVDGVGSGYGTTSVPVLAANNYDLEGGETSVFQRELGGRKGNYGEVKRKAKMSGVDFESQDFCQVCGDGGLLLCCPRCPVCVHQECAGVDDPKDLLSCSHHRCSSCNRNTSASGGLLFACQSCPVSFCEDCLPEHEKGFRFLGLGTVDRFAKLGFHSSNICYIHCSERCEEYAIKEFEWEDKGNERLPLPAAVDLSYAFGSEIDATIEEAVAEEICETRLRKRKVANYKELCSIDYSLTPSHLESPPEKPAAEDPDFIMIDDDDYGDAMNAPGSNGLAGAGAITIVPKVLTASAPVTVVPPTAAKSYEASKVMGEMQKSELSVKSTSADTLPSHTGDRYDVVFPLMPSGYLLALEQKGNSTVFKGYLRQPGGEIGPAEDANRVRAVGDRVVAVERVDVTRYSTPAILDLLGTYKGLQKHVVVTFEAKDGGSHGSSERRKTFPPDGAIGKENSYPKQGAENVTGFRPLLKRKSANVTGLVSSDSVRPLKYAASSLKASSVPPSRQPSVNQDEYQVVLPVTQYGLLLEVGTVNGETLVLGYRRTPDGSKGPAEINSLIRGAGDKILEVNRTDVASRSFKEIIEFIRASQRNASHVTMRLRHVELGTPPAFSDARPTVKSFPAPARTVAGLVPTMGKPLANEYDISVPMTSRGLMMRLGDLEGMPVFLQYRRFADGTMGPAEKKNLVRNKGDKLVAVNGVKVKSYQHAIKKIQEDKMNSVAHLRFQTEGGANPVAGFRSG